MDTVECRIVEKSQDCHMTVDYESLIDIVIMIMILLT